MEPFLFDKLQISLRGLNIGFSLNYRLFLDGIPLFSEVYFPRIADLHISEPLLGQRLDERRKRGIASPPQLNDLSDGELPALRNLKIAKLDALLDLVDPLPEHLLAQRVAHPTNVLHIQ